jgi:hypothetical protein
LDGQSRFQRLRPGSRASEQRNIETELVINMSKQRKTVQTLDSNDCRWPSATPSTQTSFAARGGCSAGPIARRMRERPSSRLPRYPQSQPSIIEPIRRAA